MSTPFDHIASTYDSTFSKSMIGQLQRKQIWDYLERKITPELSGLEILELNCGTGEDALLFSELGFNIVATDVSEEMLKLVMEKASHYSMQNKISSHYLDLDNLDGMIFEKKFDLIFSNFGGLNCINPESFQNILLKIPTLLSPGGRFVGVIMPKFCLWETLYFLAKFQFKKAFRRMSSKEVMADLEGTLIKTWYYNPSQVKKWSQEKFNVITTKPIGLLLPPSYLENFFLKRKTLLLRFHTLEKKLNRFSFLSCLSDHFLIDLKLK